MPCWLGGLPSGSLGGGGVGHWGGGRGVSVCDRVSRPAGVCQTSQTCHRGADSRSRAGPPGLARSAGVRGSSVASVAARSGHLPPCCCQTEHRDTRPPPPLAPSPADLTRVTSVSSGDMCHLFRCLLSDLLMSRLRFSSRFPDCTSLALRRGLLHLILDDVLRPG